MQHLLHSTARFNNEAGLDFQIPTTSGSNNTAISLEKKLVPSGPPVLYTYNDIWPGVPVFSDKKGATVLHYSYQQRKT